jgi:predicted aspartyl protease
MIRGQFITVGGRARPIILAHIAFPLAGVSGDVNLLVDTGADGTLLSPSDATKLGLDVTQLASDSSSLGVGGSVPTVHAEADLTLGGLTYRLRLRVLAPLSSAQRGALARIPSLLGRDLLSHFALFFEERTGRVLLLTPEEADTLALPDERAAS